MGNNSTRVPLSKDAIARFAQILLGLIFVIAAWPKIWFPFEFLSIVYSYGFVGREIGLAIAMIFPWVEFIIGISLLINFWSSEANSIAVLLLCIFLLAQILVLKEGVAIPCGCFGLGANSEEAIGYVSVLRTGGLLILALVALFLSFHIPYFKRKK